MLGFDEYAREPEELDLDVGAFLIARDAYPALDVGAQIGRLDALAEGLGEPNAGAFAAEDAARVISRYLYEQLGFRGNEDAYGDPRNSYLSDVLDRRLGIPISLAIVLLAIARRVGIRASGVSFPGHFLVRYERPRGGPLVVDPFYGGRALGHPELERLLRRTAGQTARLQVDHLKPATSRAMLVRVLQNLKGSHLARGDLPKALLAAARIVSLVPREPSALRDRGVLQAQLGAPEGARSDLLRYLELAPDASDVGAVRQILVKIGTRSRASAAN